MASSGDKVLYFLVGGFVGASVALLFAPKSGEETRRYLSDKYNEGTERVREGREFVKGKVREGREYAEKAIDEGRERLHERSRDVSDRVSDTIERGRDAVKTERDRLAAAVEAGKETYRKERGNAEEGGESAPKPESV